MRSTRRIQIPQHLFFAVFACFCSNSFLGLDFFHFPISGEVFYSLGPVVFRRRLSDSGGRPLLMRMPAFDAESQ